MVRLTADLVLQTPQFTNALGERELCLRGRNLQHLEGFAAADAAATRAHKAAAGKKSGGGEDDDDVMGDAGAATASRAGDLLFELACSFDVVDLSDNALQRIDGIDYMHRLPAALANGTATGAALVGDGLQRVPRWSTIIAHNNRLNRIAPGAVRSLAPTLHTFVAHNNRFAELSDIEVFGSLPNLERLSLKGNPVETKPHYRLFLISRCKKLKLLDYARVRDAERAEAAEWLKLQGGGATATAAKGRTKRRDARKMFDSEQGAALSALGALGDDSAAVGDKRAAAGGARGRAQPAAAGEEKRLTQEEIDARLASVQARLEAAQTAEELDTLEREYNTLLEMTPA